MALKEKNVDSNIFWFILKLLYIKSQNPLNKTKTSH